MLSKTLLGVAVLVTTVCSQSVTSLSLTARSGGSSTVIVPPGTIVNYEIVGTLSNTQNEGLAMFSLDLSYSGGSLVPAATPSSAPLVNFTNPLGFTNPAGYGGTPANGALVQVGGAQNTINYFFGGSPSGPVVTQVAWPAQPAILVTGSLVAPLAVGTTTLSITNVLANALRQGQTGNPIWKVDALAISGLTGLTISVRSLTRDVESLSISNPGVQNLSLDAGPAFAGRMYFLLGTISGTAPGIALAPGQTIPLNFDAYTQYTLDAPNGPILQNSMGVLNAQGHANAAIVLPAGLPPVLATVSFHHAFVTLAPIDFASNAAGLGLSP